MKLVLLFIAVLISTVCEAKEINIPNTGISFVAPNEFELLPQELIDFKWPQNRAPKWVVGNDNGATTIAFDLKENDISNASLPELMDSFKGVFDRVIPGIKWHKREVVELSGVSWVCFEMTSNAIDTDIHNIMLFTSYGKQMLIFNFNSTKEEFPKYEAEFRKSINTIKLP